MRNRTGDGEEGRELAPLRKPLLNHDKPLAPRTGVAAQLDSRGLLKMVVWRNGGSESGRLRSSL